MDARHNVSEIEMRAIVTRADGTVEDLGRIAYWHKNPLKRWSFGIRHYLTTGRRGRIYQ